MTSTNINLKQELLKYNVLYRNGAPEISDIEYDNLLEQFKSNVLEEEYNEFREKLFESPGKIKHPYIMGSLEKTKADEGDESLQKWLNKNNIKTLFVSSKIDGLSVRLQYRDGILIDAVTRGDGEYGESIYNKALCFVQAQLPEQFTGNIRGEIVLTKNNFIKLCEMDNKDYKNSRTSACGLINSKEFDPKQIKLLKVVTYEIIGENSQKQIQYNKLSSMGFETAKSGIVSILNSSEENKKLLMEVYNKWYEECDYDIDGLVLTSTFNDKFENVKIPKNTVAFKTNLLIKETSILDIEWNISKSGFLKPVALLDPVELGGAMISRATLYNMNYVICKKICYNAKVIIKKSGDIIPHVENIDNTGHNKFIDIPTVCPHCNSKLITDGVELRCPNLECSEQLLLKISQLFRRLDIDDASTKTLRNLNIMTFEDLLNWRPDQSYKSQVKLYNEILKKIFNIDKITLFASLDCDGIGEKTVNKIIEYFGFDNVLTRTFYKVGLPEGIGEITFKTFLNTLDYNINIYNMFILDSRYNEPEVIQISSCNNVHLSDKSFCFTGKLETMSRSEAEKLVINNGGKISGVNKNLTYLVTNDKDSGSSKNKKAEQLGITLINEEEFINMINCNKEDINSL